MPQWGLTDAVASDPKFSAQIIDAAAGPAAMLVASNNMYQNVSSGAFPQTKGQAVGVWAVSPTHMANTSGEAKRINHTGWNLRRAGTGPVASVAPLVGGTGYSNTDLIKVSGGQVNAAGTLVTNSTGGITSVTITTPGSGFTNVSASTVAVTNSSGSASAGSSGTFTLTLGGRAGRVSYETLEAGFISSQTNTTIFPVT